jgi:hypothetical protein
VVLCIRGQPNDTDITKQSDHRREKKRHDELRARRRNGSNGRWEL